MCSAPSKRRLWRYLLWVLGCIAMATCVLLMMPGQGSNKHWSSVAGAAGAPKGQMGKPRWNDYVVSSQDQERLLKQLQGDLGGPGFESRAGQPGLQKPKEYDNAQDMSQAHIMQNPVLLTADNDLEKKTLQPPVRPNTYFMEVQKEVKPIFHPNPQTCASDQGVFVLIGVFSAFHRHELRQAIRTTWANNKNTQPLNIRVVFIMGNPFQKTSEISKAIFEESKTNEDMLLLDMEDHYRTLSLKMLGYLNWVSKYCSNVKYIMKTDDDVFVNVHLLAQEIQIVDSPTNLMMGHVIKEAEPIRDKNNKWHMPLESYYNSMYPNYLSGTAYVISRDLVERLLKESREMKVFWLEDIFFTGFLPMKTFTPLIHNSKFNHLKLKHAGPCFVQTVVSMHEVSPLEMHKLFHSMSDPSCDDNGLHLH